MWISFLVLFNQNIKYDDSNIGFFPRYQTLNRYKLVKKYRIEDVQQITTFSCINGFYSCILFVIHLLSSSGFHRFAVAPWTSYFLHYFPIQHFPRYEQSILSQGYPFRMDFVFLIRVYG